MSEQFERQIDRAADRARGAMYRKEPKVYPREVEGRFARLRSLAMWGLLGLFYGVCWLPWGDRQAVLFDLPARKFHVFDLTFWPQDFIYLALLLIVAGLSLFFFTALAGRLWCGYACPQTVWTEAFLRMERWVEGDRARRMKLDGAPWTTEKVMRKTAKQVLWIGFALWTGFTFVGYFTPIRILAAEVLALQTGPWETFWVLFYALATYGNAGYLREQVCKYMCPYARFQSAMFDQDTLVISYDSDRGEPRGGRGRDADREQIGLGDCINCTLCVQVCPTGIDIRDGLQIECIACAACVDVCDRVMDKMDYPRGLVRYTTEQGLRGRATRFLRPRLAIYAGLLVVVIAALIVSIAGRVPLRMEVIRDRNALYRVIGPQIIENVYTLRLINMEDGDRRYRIRVEGLAGLSIDSDTEIDIAAGNSTTVPLRLRAEHTTRAGGQAIRFVIQSLADPAVQVSRDSTFFLPVE